MANEHKPTIKVLRRQTGADSTVYVTWNPPSSGVNGYTVEWKYDTGDHVWFPGSTSEVDAGIVVNTYNFPSNAVKVMVKVAGLYDNKKKKDWSDVCVLDLKTGKKTVGISTKKVNQITGIEVDLQSGQGSDGRTLYATWSWNYKNTDHYVVTWQYATGDGVWFDGAESNVTRTVATYSAPSNAKKVRVKVLPVSKTYKVYSDEFSYWNASVSTFVIYTFGAPIVVATPSVPSVTISAKTLIAEVSTYDTNIDLIEFQVVKNNSSIVYSAQIKPKTNRAAITYSGSAGASYKVRCRAIKIVTVKFKTLGGTVTKKTTTKTADSNLYSAWSEYSSSVSTTPNPPTNGILKHIAPSINSVWLYWTRVADVTGYDVEYTTNKNYFDHNGETTVVSLSSNVDRCFIDGLTAVTRYYFRIRSKNSAGDSDWAKSIYSLILDTTPGVPTTWNESDSVIYGESVRLFWIHNSEDGSVQSEYEVRVHFDTGWQATIFSGQNSDDHILIDTSTPSYNLSAGNVVAWCVRTKGISKWSDWSVVRAITVYAQPSVEMVVTSGTANLYSDPLSTFPIMIDSIASPREQRPISWQYSIIALSDYDITNFDGQIKHVSAGDEIFSSYMLAKNPQTSHLVLSAGDVDLYNNASYELTVTVSMSSGLKAFASCQIAVAWSGWDDLSAPTAEIAIDEDTLAAYIRPYCSATFEQFQEAFDDIGGAEGLIDENGDAILDHNGSPIMAYEIYEMTESSADPDDQLFNQDILQDCTLSVFRREYDGSFVEIASDLPNNKLVTVNDPHPSLNFARYRIVARDNVSGQISFSDIPGIPVGITDIIIQWDEQWSDFNMGTGIPNWYSEKPWSGSLLRLPYNVQVTDTFDHDINHVEYIGRKYPVSYFGTQVGMTSSWKTDIPREDTEMLYALRRLSAYMGNCYVREPYGTGYWATVKVSYSKTHNNVLIPVTLTITRVEGGV